MNIKYLTESVNEFLKLNKDIYFFDRNNKKLFSCISAGIQSADHPVFKRIKNAVKNHLLPADFFMDKYPQDTNELSVVSFAFHYSTYVVNDNSMEKKYSSYSWYELRDKFNYLIKPFIE